MTAVSVVVTFMNGPADGRWVIVQADHVTVGRGPDNDVVIDFDPGVTKTHLSIEYRDGRWQLEDRSGGAGVFLEGVRIRERAELVPDRLVSLGDTLLRIGLMGDT